MFFQLKVAAKDKKVLKVFLNFFSALQKTSSTWTIVSNSINKNVITILKSPHVNKTAQEQFEYRIYTKKILINSYKPFLFLLTLKKIKGLSFPGLSIKVTGMPDKENKFGNTLTLLNPKNFNLPVDKTFFKYVQLFDCHGEMLLKTKYV